MKLIIFVVLSALFFSNANAENYHLYVTNMCNGGPEGYAKAVTSDGGTSRMYFGGSEVWVSTSTLDCNDPGSNCCEWLVVAPPTSFTQDHVSQVAATNIQNGNYSGQIYSDGTTGNSTVSSINDTKNLPCYIWGYNNNVTTTVIVDYSQN